MADDALSAAVTEVLAAHQTEQLWKQGGWAGDTACSCGWRMAMWSRKDFPEIHRKHVAERVAQVVREHTTAQVAAAKAEALREAADDVLTAWHAEMVPERITQLQAADYLKARARRAERLDAEPALDGDAR